MAHTATHWHASTPSFDQDHFQLATHAAWETHPLAYSPSPRPLPPMGTQDVFTGTPGDDPIDGTGHADFFSMGDGGHDTVNGKAGNDTFAFGTAFEGLDVVDGGAGHDALLLSGDYGASGSPFFIQAPMLSSVEEIDLENGRAYWLNIFAIQNGHGLTIDGSGTSDLHVFGDFADGPMTVIGGVGNNFFQADAGDHVFYGGGFIDTGIFSGGDVKFFGYGGTDTVSMHGNGSLTPADRLDGGDGPDLLELVGTGTVVLGEQTVRNIETFRFDNNGSYGMTTAEGTVASGATLTVDASSLKGSRALTFEGSLETNGRFNMAAGHGADTLTGGEKNDVIKGGGGDDVIVGGQGSDTLTGADGGDTFGYNFALESTGKGHDVVKEFSAAADVFHIVPLSITGVDADVTSGKVNAGKFDAGVSHAILPAQMAAGHAVLFTPDTGTLAGHVYLIIDGNGVSGYQPGADFVIELIDAVDTAITGANFI